MRRRVALVSVVAALGALVTAAPPAAATNDTPVCAALNNDVQDLVAASICVTGDTGFYEPLYVSCSTIYGCWARVAAGHRGSAHVEAEVCFDTVTIDPLCVATGSGAIPLVYVAPQYVCFNDSPWGPPCVPDDEP